MSLFRDDGHERVNGPSSNVEGEEMGRKGDWERRGRKGDGRKRMGTRREKDIEFPHLFNSTFDH